MQCNFRRFRETKNKKGESTSKYVAFVRNVEILEVFINLVCF